jgi:Clp amino terminal domain, pathogenicity island component
MERGRLQTIDELVALVESRAAEQPGVARLQAAIGVGCELADLGDALIGRFVAEAREAGLSWTEIGQLFGTSKQAAQQRYGAAVTEPGTWPGRWTPAAREALNRAGEEARALGHEYVGTEHALLALVSAERGVAAEVLRGFGVSRERMLATTCMRAGVGEPTQRDCLPLMPRFKQALEHSRRIADGVGAEVADVEHLLAGILAVPDSMAVEILRRTKAPADAVRDVLAERLGVDSQRLGIRPRRRRRLLDRERLQHAR